MGRPKNLSNAGETVDRDDFIVEVTTLVCANCPSYEECTMGEDALDEVLACLVAMKHQLQELVGSIDIANFGS